MIHKTLFSAIKKLLLVCTVLVLLLCGGLLATDNAYIFTAFSRTYLHGYRTANINDHQAFETRVIEAAEQQLWPLHEQYGGEDLPQDLVDYLEQSRSAAFLVIHKGRVLRERYFAEYSETSKTNSFSMAKTVITLLLGIAIDEGLVDGLDQKIIDFLPEFADQTYGSQATVGSLSSMTSGYEWNERYYNAFSPTVELLYGDSVADFVLGGRFTTPPGSSYYYSSASVQILAVLLTRALKQRDPDATLASYLSEKLWQPLGMNASGLWHLDNSGMELAFCCLNTNARNYAKLGQLMLQDGAWEGKQLVLAAFVELMRTPQADDRFGYSSWINERNDPPYYSLNGHLGQYVIIVPDYELVIVRLGEIRRPEQAARRSGVSFYIEQVLPLLPATD